MAFTTGGQRLAPVQRHFRQLDELAAAYKDRIDDLESAYLCNVTLLLDVTSAKTVSRTEHSKETESQYSFPMPCFKKLKEQQRLLKEAITRLSSELFEARHRAKDFDRRCEESKASETKSVREILIRIREAKRCLQEKDGIIQSLEKEHIALDVQASLAMKDREDGMNGQFTTEKMKKLVKEVKIEANRVELEKELVKERCQV